MRNYCISVLLIGVKSTAEERGGCDCAICMLPVKLGSKPYSLLQLNSFTATRSAAQQKGSIILSCTHIFHHHCISNFEKFIGDGVSRMCAITKLLCSLVPVFFYTV